MNDDKDIPVLDHGYDGITEFDNPLPLWWLVTFFATIIFAFHYWVHYELGGGQSIKDELKQDMAKIEKLHKAAPQSTDTEESLQKLVGVAAIASKGASAFEAKCAVCHGKELQGVIGPNLTDDYWIHGKGTLTDIAKVIRTGVADKGMPVWEGQIPEDDIRALVIFVASKHGSHPSAAKEPQGQKVEY